MRPTPTPRRRTAAALRPLAGAVAAALLAGCADGGAGDPSPSAPPAASLELAPPAPLLASRAVDRDALEPIVTLSTGQRVVMSRVPGTDQWSGTVQVRPSSTVVVSIEWRIVLARGPLGLARAERRVDVGEAGGAATVDAGGYDYDTGLDEDGDGTPNLAELNASTDPFVDEGAVIVIGPEDVGPDVSPPGGGADGMPGTVVAPDPDDEDDEDDDDDEDEDEDDEDRDDDPRPDAAVIDLYVPRISRSAKPDIDGQGRHRRSGRALRRRVGGGRAGRRLRSDARP